MSERRTQIALLIHKMERRKAAANEKRVSSEASSSSSSSSSAPSFGDDFLDDYSETVIYNGKTWYQLDNKRIKEEWLMVNGDPALSAQGFI